MARCNWNPNTDFNEKFISKANGLYENHVDCNELKESKEGDRLEEKAKELKEFEDNCNGCPIKVPEFRIEGNFSFLERYEPPATGKALPLNVEQSKNSDLYKKFPSANAYWYSIYKAKKTIEKFSEMFYAIPVYVRSCRHQLSSLQNKKNAGCYKGYENSEELKKIEEAFEAAIYWLLNKAEELKIHVNNDSTDLRDEFEECTLPQIQYEDKTEKVNGNSEISQNGKTSSEPIENSDEWDVFEDIPLAPMQNEAEIEKGKEVITSRPGIEKFSFMKIGPLKDAINKPGFPKIEKTSGVNLMKSLDSELYKKFPSTNVYWCSIDESKNIVENFSEQFYLIPLYVRSCKHELNSVRNKIATGFFGDYKDCDELKKIELAYENAIKSLMDKAKELKIHVNDDMNDPRNEFEECPLAI